MDDIFDILRSMNSSGEVNMQAPLYINYRGENLPISILGLPSGDDGGIIVRKTNIPGSMVPEILDLMTNYYKYSTNDNSIYESDLKYLLAKEFYDRAEEEEIKNFLKDRGIATTGRPMVELKQQYDDIKNGRAYFNLGRQPWQDALIEQAQKAANIYNTNAVNIGRPEISDWLVKYAPESVIDLVNELSKDFPYAFLLGLLGGALSEFLQLGNAAKNTGSFLNSARTGVTRLANTPINIGSRVVSAPGVGNFAVPAINTTLGLAAKYAAPLAVLAAAPYVIDGVKDWVNPSIGGYDTTPVTTGNEVYEDDLQDIIPSGIPGIQITPTPTSIVYGNLEDYRIRDWANAGYNPNIMLDQTISEDEIDKELEGDIEYKTSSFKRQLQIREEVRKRLQQSAEEKATLGENEYEQTSDEEPKPEEEPEKSNIFDRVKRIGLQVGKLFKRTFKSKEKQSIDDLLMDIRDRYNRGELTYKEALELTFKILRNNLSKNGYYTYDLDGTITPRRLPKGYKGKTTLEDFLVNHKAPTEAKPSIFNRIANILKRSKKSKETPVEETPTETPSKPALTKETPTEETPTEETPNLESKTKAADYKNTKLSQNNATLTLNSNPNINNNKDPNRVRWYDKISRIVWNTKRNSPKMAEKGRIGWANAARVLLYTMALDKERSRKLGLAVGDRFGAIPSFIGGVVDAILGESSNSTNTQLTDSTNSKELEELAKIEARAKAIADSIRDITNQPQVPDLTLPTASYTPAPQPALNDTVPGSTNNAAVISKELNEGNNEIVEILKRRGQGK